MMKAFISKIDVSHDMIDVGMTRHQIVGRRSVVLTVHLIEPSSEDMAELREKMSGFPNSGSAVYLSFSDPEPPEPTASNISKSHSVLGSW